MHLRKRKENCNCYFWFSPQLLVDVCKQRTVCRQYPLGFQLFRHHLKYLQNSRNKKISPLIDLKEFSYVMYNFFSPAIFLTPLIVLEDAITTFLSESSMSYMMLTKGFPSGTRDTPHHAFVATDKKQ